MRSSTFPKPKAAAFLPAFSAEMWEIHLGQQVVTFLLATVLGFVFAAGYGLLSATGRLFGAGRVAETAGDLLFWVAAAVVTFCFLLARTNGEIRGFVLFGQAVGFLGFYRFLFRKWARALDAIGRPIARAVGFLSRFFQKSTVWMADWLQKRIKTLKKAEKSLKNS